jgi:conjugal transfer pilus assembly protein TraV
MKCHIRPRGVGVIPICAALLVSCSSITGLDGTSQYACKAPEGVKCDSVSGNYYNALQNNLPSQRKSTGITNPADRPEPQDAPVVRASARTGASAIPTAIGAAVPVAGSAYMAAPLRAGPRVLRLWIKPWEDADRDLNGESLVYLQIDNGRWLVDHVQRQAREPYAPIRPTRFPNSASKSQSPDPRDAEARSQSQQRQQLQQDQSAAEDGSAVSQVLRALQARPAATPGN